jgi:sialidase-1
MNRTRREFGRLSSVGIGGVLASGGGFAAARESSGPSIVPIREDPKFSCFEINLCRGQGREVLATFGRAASNLETGDILLARSSDGGLTWQRPASAPLFSHPGPGHQTAGITRLSDGLLIASTTRFQFLFEGKLRFRRGSATDGVFVRTSSDGGNRWDDVRQVDTSPFHVAWTRGSIVEIADGSLLLPLAGQRGERYKDVRQPIASFVMRSSDRGKTWNCHATIAEDVNGSRDFDEPAMVDLGGARLLCMLRSHVSPRRDLPGGYLYTTLSEDGGATWSKVQKTSMWGHPAHLLRLRDGRILCTYGYRMHPGPGVRGCVSQGGTEWKPQDIFSVKAMPDLDSDHLQIGCPSSVELDDRRILTAYQIWIQERQVLEGSLYHI